MFPQMLTKEQQEQLAEIQKHTKFITAEILQEGNKLTVELVTDNADAARAIPQIQTSMIDSLASCLQVMFAITGRVKGKKT